MPVHTDGAGEALSVSVPLGAVPTVTARAPDTEPPGQLLGLVAGGSKVAVIVMVTTAPAGHGVVGVQVAVVFTVAPAAALLTPAEQKWQQQQQQQEWKHKTLFP